MHIKDYFAEARGIGVLATADARGKVDAAIYARPRVMEDGTLAFIMRERLTHHNLQENPCAAYLFIEEGHGYQGVRLFLRKVREDTDAELIGEMTRRWLSPQEDAAKGPKFIVYFALEGMRKLIGSDVPDLQAG